ncbi:alpha/beta hydrolase [Exiguobacterium acetylicum]|uniref:alpha/beta hydrolase n=1 Tax=Exiguobacterium acetylicum TaxID=41170 RepID=UPI0027E04059|nr:alpha/beta hydrolase [Exiguobacterium acetylicum]MDQ6466844.1 alpha/beta hydrolase [Exiguobacterium acetylicum]
MNRQQMIDLAEQIRSGEERPKVTPPQPPQAITSTLQVPTSIGDVRVLLHSPIDAADILPGFISFHGGGFITGTPEMDKPWNLFLAETVNCHVFNIEYPLAPEHPFPVPVHVTYEVVQWISQHADTLHLDAARIAIGGHSAGGNLATAISLWNAEQTHPVPLIAQILDYPPLDLATDPADKPFFEEAIPTEQARQFNAMYIARAEDAYHHLASPLYAAQLEALPKTLILTAEHDSLAQEAQQYAKRLQAAGVHVEHQEFAVQPHAFTHHGDANVALQAWQRIADFLRHVFQSAKRS